MSGKPHIGKAQRQREARSVRRLRLTRRKRMAKDLPSALLEVYSDFFVDRVYENSPIIRMLNGEKGTP